MKYLSYAGIGSRETPQEILELMTGAAISSAREGLILRSGGADGADSAFEGGAPADMKEIYLPWEGFNGRSSREPGVISGIPEKAFEIAAQHHPYWRSLKDSVRALMARNVLQVLGQNLTEPVLFVLCWTPNGSGKGGTGQAIRLANSLGVPVFDMGKTPLNEIEVGVNLLLEQAKS